MQTKNIIILFKYFGVFVHLPGGKFAANSM